MYRTRTLFLCAALSSLAAAFAALPSRDAGTVNWDDGKYLSAAPSGLTPSSAAALFAGPHLGLYKPLTLLSLSLDRTLRGTAPRVFHETNIILHALNAALAFWLCLLLTRNAPAALLAALALGAHPMHMESVAWISERKDMLYSFFFLASCCLYLIWREGKGGWLYAASLFSFALCLCAKPMGVTLPAALLLFDWMQGRSIDKQALKEKLPFLALAALVAALTLFWTAQAGVQAQVAGFWRRLSFAAYGLWFYLYKGLLPLGLSCFYPYPAPDKPLPATYILALLATPPAAFLAWKRLRGERALLGGLAFFTLCLLPALGFFPVGRTVVADRYAYLAHTGLFLACGLALHKLWRKLRPGKAAYLVPALAAAAIAVLALEARQRCAVWQDSVSLWGDALEKNRNEPLIRSKLTEAFLERGDLKSALRAAEQSLQDGVSDAEVLNNYAAALDKSGRPELALAQLEKGASLYPLHAGIRHNIGILLARRGLLPQARPQFEKALELDPSMAQAAEALRRLDAMGGNPAKGP